MQRKERCILISIISLFIFILIAISVNCTSSVVELDKFISKAMDNIREPWLTGVMISLSELGEWYSIVIISLIIVVILLYEGRKRDAMLFPSFLIGGFLLEYTLKIIIGRERPLHGVIHVSGYSFPSGHATMVALLFLLVSLICRNKSVHIISAILILLVGFSRIYLNVHWMSDVLAGYVLAIHISSIFLLVRERKLT